MTYFFPHTPEYRGLLLSIPVNKLYIRHIKKGIIFTWYQYIKNDKQR